MKDMDRLFGAFLFGLFIGLMAHSGTKLVRILTIGDSPDGMQEVDASQANQPPARKIELVSRATG